MFTRCVLTPLTAGIAVGVLLGGCGSDSPDAASAVVVEVTDAVATTTDADDESGADDAVDANGTVVDVIARDNSFLPEEIEISAGTEIRWENRGRNDHNVLPADEASGWGVDAEGFAPGDVYSEVFATPGTYPYYCSLHGTSDFGMIGTIVVTE
jgi:plastocyanin